MSGVDVLTFAMMSLGGTAIVAFAWGGSWRNQAKELGRELEMVKQANQTLRERHRGDEKRAESLIKQLEHSIKYIRGEV